MKHSLQLRLSQHLTLTPQLQQSIRLLQLSTLELNQELERILQDNPMLEREDDARELPAATPESLARGTDAPAASESPAPDTTPGDADPAEFSGTDDGPATGHRDDDGDGEYQQIAEDAPT